MAVSHAPACGPACECSIAREARGIECNSTWSRKKGLRVRDARRCYPCLHSPSSMSFDVCVILRARCGPAREAHPRRGVCSSLRPRAVTCRRPPPADKQGRVHRTGLAESMQQRQGCVWRGQGAHQPKLPSKPQGQCEPLGRGPARSSTREGGRCLVQDRQRPRQAK